MSKQKMKIDETIEELKGIQKFLCGEAKEVFDNLNETSITETINTAIKALEIQNRKPFDPFIDDIDEGSYYCGFTAGKRSVTKWTPVSMGFPDKNGRYLVTVKQGYIAFGIWVGVAENWTEVIAWMPLPEPYKENNDV